MINGLSSPTNVISCCQSQGPPWTPTTLMRAVVGVCCPCSYVRHARRALAQEVPECPEGCNARHSLACCCSSLFLTLAEFRGMSPPICCHQVLERGHVSINLAKTTSVAPMCEGGLQTKLGLERPNSGCSHCLLQLVKVFNRGPRVSVLEGGRLAWVQPRREPRAGR